MENYAQGLEDIEKALLLSPDHKKNLFRKARAMCYL